MATKGPWHWIAGDHPNGYIALLGPDTIVARSYEDHIDAGVPDAALIAAAPELLEALEHFGDAYALANDAKWNFDSENGAIAFSGLQEAVLQARAAIARARGK